MKSVMKYIIYTLSVVGIGYLFILSIFSTSYICRCDKGYEFTYYTKDNPWMYLGLFIIVCLIGLFFINRKPAIRINPHIVRGVIYFVVALLLSGWVWMIQLFPDIDQWYVLESAIDFLKHDATSFLPGGYMFIYPNQIGLMLLECIPVVLFGEKSYVAIQFFNVICVIGIYYFLGKITKVLFRERDFSLCTEILAIAYLPIAIFVTFVYGTIPGLLLSLMGFYYLLKYLESHSKKTLVISMCCLLVACIIKNNYLIMLLAAFIVLLLHADRKKTVYTWILILTILLLYSIAGKAMNRMVSSYLGVEVNSGVPKIAWVAMGMQSSEESAPGWFNGYNSMLYTNCNYDYEYAKKVATKEVLRQLQCRADDLNYTSFFYGRKIASQWNNPTFECTWVYGTWKEKADGKIQKWMAVVLDNKRIVQLANILQSFILLGSLFYIIYNWKKENVQNILLPICVIGGIAFHIIWEAKTQYALPYFVMLIPMAVLGLRAFLLDLNDAIHKRKLWCKASVTCVVLSIFILASALPTTFSQNAIRIEQDCGLYRTNAWN